MAAKTRLSLDGYGSQRSGSFAGKSVDLSLQRFLYIIDIALIPSASGVVQLQSLPINGALSVTIRQGSLGFLREVLE